MLKNNFKKGIALAEILVSIFVFSIVLSSLITISNFYLTSASSNLKSVKATYLAEEGIEALRIMRDTNWNTFSTISSGEKYFYFAENASSTWIATTTLIHKKVDSINRWFILSSVNRDTNNKIVSTGGTNDPNTKKATVYVSYLDQNKNITKSISTYLTNIIVD